MKIRSYPFDVQNPNTEEMKVKLALLLFETVYRMIVREKRTLPVTFTVTVGVEAAKQGASHFYADVGERDE